MNVFIVVIGGFLSFLIAMIILVKKEENVEKDILKNGMHTTGFLKKSVLKRKSATKQAMRISYLVTYAYNVKDITFVVNTIFEMNMDDVNTEIPKMVDIYYDEKNPKTGFVKYESTKKISCQSTSKGIYIAIGIGVFISLILYHFCIQRIV